jgi:hypothetical protein
MKFMGSLESAAASCLTMLLAVVVLITASPDLLKSAERKADPSASMPFAPGERLRFRLRWTVVPAGEAILEVLPFQTIDGQRTYHFRLTARSNLIVDQFYKVRDRIDAFASIDMTRAILYNHKQHEGDNRKNVKVRFNWEKDIALYNDGQTDSEIPVKPGTFDPLSVFYYSRLADLDADGLIRCPVSDGKKCVNGQARVVKKETIKVLCGWYETYLIEPDLKHVGGVFEKSKDAKIRIWVTADERRIPVKIASKVAIGSFVGELVAIENALPRTET